MSAATAGPYRAGYDDGSGLEYVLDAAGDTVAVTSHGCGCCQPAITREDEERAVRIARTLTACAGLDLPADVPVGAVKDALQQAAAVVASIPATYDETHPDVQRHARELLRLQAALAALGVKP